MSRQSRQLRLTSLEGALSSSTKTSDPFDTSRFNAVTAVVNITAITGTAKGDLIVQQSPDKTTWVQAAKITYALTAPDAIQVTYQPIMAWTRIVLKPSQDSCSIDAAWAEAKT